MYLFLAPTSSYLFPPTINFQGWGAFPQSISHTSPICPTPQGALKSQGDRIMEERLRGDPERVTGAKGSVSFPNEHHLVHQHGLAVRVVKLFWWDLLLDWASNAKQKTERNVVTKRVTSASFSVLVPANQPVPSEIRSMDNSGEANKILSQRKLCWRVAVLVQISSSVEQMNHGNRYWLMETGRASQCRNGIGMQNKQNEFVLQILLGWMQLWNNTHDKRRYSREVRSYKSDSQAWTPTLEQIHFGYKQRLG